MLLPVPTFGDVENDLHSEVTFGYCDGGLSDGIHHKIMCMLTVLLGVFDA